MAKTVHGDLLQPGWEQFIRAAYRNAKIDLTIRDPWRPWIPDADNFLIECYERGMTPEETAKVMNRSPGAIIGRIYDLAEWDQLRPEWWGRKAKDKKGLAKGPLNVKGFFVKR